MAGLSKYHHVGPTGACITIPAAERTHSRVSDTTELKIDVQSGSRSVFKFICLILDFWTLISVKTLTEVTAVGRMETVKTAEAALLLRAGGVLQTAMELNALVPWQLIFSSLENYENNTISDLQVSFTVALGLGFN